MSSAFSVSHLFLFQALYLSGKAQVTKESNIRLAAMSGEPVGDFYVHLLQRQEVSKEMTSSTNLLRLSNGNRPSVIHFYDGG